MRGMFLRLCLVRVRNVQSVVSLRRRLREMKYRCDEAKSPRAQLKSTRFSTHFVLMALPWLTLTSISLES